MKVTNLMNGDWVNVFDTPKQIEGIRKFRNGDEIVYYDGDNGNYIKTVTPIPLTSEILEKNGFNRLDQIASVEPYYWFFFNKETEVKIKAFNTIYRGLWVECVNPVNNATIYKQCEFVHEFQHVLRLCEIEKEIIL